MPDVSTIILYVRDPERSARFFSELLGKPVLETSPNFAMLPIAPVVMLGLWAVHDVAPAAITPGDPLSSNARGELAITVPDRDTVLATHADWIRRGVRIIQAPSQLDFGFTFTAIDLDGHRLRVMALPA